MSFQNRKLDYIGLGEPDVKTPLSADIQVTKGTKTKLTLDRNHESNQAKDGLNTANNVTEKHGILGSTISLKGENPMTPFNESCFARIEQLLQESKLILEDRMTYKDRVPSAAAGAGGNREDGKGVSDHSNQGYKPTTADINKNLTTKISMQNSKHNTSVDNAARIEPQITNRGQTIGLTQSATNQASQGKLLGAQNHQQVLANKEDEALASGQG